MKKIVRKINRKIKNIKQGFPSRECWSLDYTFIKWLNGRLVVYLRDASEIVDLSFHKFQYEEYEYTQEEIVKEMIRLSSLLIDDDNYFHKDVDNELDKLLDLFKLSFRSLWW